MNYITMALQTTKFILDEYSSGDILVYLASNDDIDPFCNMLKEIGTKNAKVIRNMKQSYEGRKIYVAANKGYYRDIRYVIDSCLEKNKYYDYQSQIERVIITFNSKQTLTDKL